MIDQVLDGTDLPPQLRNKCLSTLRKICGRHALFPESLKIPFDYDRSRRPTYGGGYGDVWKGESQGREVAVKELKVCPPDFSKIKSVGRLSLSTIQIIDFAIAEVLQRGGHLEGSPPPERTTIMGSEDG